MATRARWLGDLRAGVTSAASAVLPLLVFGCGGATPAAGDPPDPAVAEIRLALEAYYRDFSARDWKAFADHFWPGADLTTVWQPPGETATRVVATPVPEFVLQAPSGPEAREIFEERMLAADILVSGHLAQAWVQYRVRFGDPGEVDVWEGTDAFSLLRLNGRWKIASLAFVPGDR